MMKPVLLVVGLLVVGAVAALLAQSNAGEVSVSLLFAQAEAVPLWRALFVAFAFGVLATGAASIWPLLRLRLSVRRQRRRISLLEQEVHGLRTLPLHEELSGAGPPAREA